MGISFIGIEGNRDGYSPDQCAETCTVRELIDALEYFDNDMPVYLINDNGYTYGSISARDIDEHFVNNDGDLDEEDYEDDEYEDDEDLDECKLHIPESGLNKSHMHESHRIRKNKLSIKRTHKHPKLTK